MQVAEEV